eukprot:PhF_6_TR6889/c0_g1_i2/m.9967
MYVQLHDEDNYERCWVAIEKYNSCAVLVIRAENFPSDGLRQLVQAIPLQDITYVARNRRSDLGFLIRRTGEKEESIQCIALSKAHREEWVSSIQICCPQTTTTTTATSNTTTASSIDPTAEAAVHVASRLMRNVHVKPIKPLADLGTATTPQTQLVSQDTFFDADCTFSPQLLQQQQSSSFTLQRAPSESFFSGASLLTAHGGGALDVVIPVPSVGEKCPVCFLDILCVPVCPVTDVFHEVINPTS